VYGAVPQSTTSVVEDGKPRFDVVRENLLDVVVWNPWSVKAKSMGDFWPQDGYIKMICVETGSVNEWINLEGGDSWEGGQIIKSLK
jgi:glucose-6-phosphate 1-epimerase